MQIDQIVPITKSKLEEAFNYFIEDLKTIRTGRANAAILDGVTVEAYGTYMPLKQIANVVAVEAQLLQVTPFDPSNIANISEAIRNNSSLGLNPSDDGKIIRLPIPPLTEERRREMTRQIRSKEEDCMVKIRNIRHDAMNAIDKLKKDKVIGEDEAKRQQKIIDENVSEKRKIIEDEAKEKENEILNI